MAKLAQYMADFAELLGKEHAVHFVDLEEGRLTSAEVVGIRGARRRAGATPTSLAQARRRLGWSSGPSARVEL